MTDGRCEQTGYYDETFAQSNYNDYDLRNNLKSISRHEDGDKGETFTYDDANQLSSVSYIADVMPHAPGGPPGGGVEAVEKDDEKETLAALAADPDREPLAKEGGEIEAVSGPRTVTYENDAINRLSMNDPNNGMATVFAANHLNQYTSVTDHGTLSYDGNFDVSGYDGWTFGHDAEKRLLSVTGHGHSALFAYDGLGRCVKRIIDGATTVFTYDGWKPVAEWTSGGAFVAWNLYGAGADEILVRYQQNPAGYLHYHLDAMGNVQFLLSDQPNPGLEKYTYDVFGKPTITGWNGDGRPVSNHGNRFLFTGREYLYSFGMYDYRHRIYHPGLGRFIETDPLGQQIERTKLSAEQTALFGDGAPTMFTSSELNLYRYCHNAPVNKNDPFGLDPVIVSNETDALAQQADMINLTNYASTSHFFGIFSHEYATSVFSNNGVQSLSETRVGDGGHVRPPEPPTGTDAPVETHNHTNSDNDYYTHSHIGRNDANRADAKGRTQEVITPDGVQQRYRPSDKPTPEERRAEGGIIEQKVNGKWVPVPGANTDLRNPYNHRNGPKNDH